MLQREKDTYYKYYFNESDASSSNDTIRPTFSETSNRFLSSLNEYYPTWMLGLIGSRRLDTVTIPGTHDTCSKSGGPLFKCQDVTLEEQLMMGVRSIDIRCRHINDVFMIHHERVFQKIGFGAGVRNVLVRFLQQHPSEFIFMFVQEEWKAKDNTRTFDETMYSYINCSEYKDFFYLNEGELPTVDHVRGKIVLFRRFNKEKLVNIDMGNYIEFAQNDVFVSKKSIIAHGQDCYKVPNLFVRSKKYEKVEKFFEKPKEFFKQLKQSTETTIFLNYGSGQSLGCYPYLVAEYVTPRIGKYVEKSYPNDFLGIIFFDFINRYYPKIIYHIIKRNFNPDQNGGLQNTFAICNSENCTNKADGTNKLYVALVIIAVIVLVALIVLLIVCLVLRFKRIQNHSEKSEEDASLGLSDKD